MTSSEKSPLTQAERRRVPSRANPARLAAAISALLSARVSACSPDPGLDVVIELSLQGRDIAVVPGAQPGHLAP